MALWFEIKDAMVSKDGRDFVWVRDEGEVYKYFPESDRYTWYKTVAHEVECKNCGMVFDFDGAKEMAACPRCLEEELANLEESRMNR